MIDMRRFFGAIQKGVTILEPPTDQPRGHRTVYFADPEGNQLELICRAV